MKHITADEGNVTQAALYALGSLSQHEARAFEEHLSAGCEVCAAEVAPFESVVKTLGLAAVKVEPPASVREKLLSQLSSTAQPEVEKIDRPSFITVRAGEGVWHQVSDDLAIKRLFADQKTGTVTSLFKFKPGAYAPRHMHEGVEQCLIIEGDFHLNNQVYGPGDFTCALEGSVHEPAYTETGTVLLIVAQAGYTIS
jgi:anti-sigma factor ChrR (cupin superfamily)